MSYVDHPRSDVITVKTIKLTEIPDTWERAWIELAQRASEPAPFVESWFIRPSIANLSPPATARLLSVWQGPRLMGVLPLHISEKYGRMPVRHVQNWQHYHAFLGSPLARAGSEQVFWAAVLAELDASEWAPAFLHLDGLVAGGPLLSALRDQRRADIVHCSKRALLKSDLSSAAYFEANIRKKKRKEIIRLRSRLADLGEIAFDRLTSRDCVTEWTTAFFKLEASGWKGREGTALSDGFATTRFFEQAVAGASVLGRLEMLRLTLDDQPIAMLVNFITPPGSFSYKIAFDERYARYSPGVLIQLENLKILDRPDVAWMDSCAVEGHTMINSIWAERRDIVRVTVPLRGRRRTVMFNLCRALENTSASFRKLR